MTAPLYFLPRLRTLCDMPGPLHACLTQRTPQPPFPGPRQRAHHTP